jgi:hypothetical protein
VARAAVLLDGDEALASLELYFGGRFTGAWFDAAGRRTDPATGAPLDQEPNRLSIEDLQSLSLLDVALKPREMIDLFAVNRDLDHLLGRIGREITLVGAPPARDVSETPWASAVKAYKLLRSVRGVGRTRASAILARKRPHLFPIWDRHVAEGLGMRGQDHDWVIVQDVVTEHLERLQELDNDLRGNHRDAGRIQGLSLLRVLDIVVWMRMHGADLIDGGDMVKIAPRALTKAP